MSGNYVVGVDGSEHSRRALEWAVGEATARSATVDAVLTWRFPVDDHPFSPTADDVNRLEAAWTDTLDEVVAEVSADGLREPIRRTMLAGTHAGKTLVEHAAAADLLVVGTRGRGGFLGLLLGSVADYCLHQAAVPTAFVPPRPLPTADRAVVGADGSESSLAALRWAVERAQTVGGEILAVHAWNWIDKPKASTWDTTYDEADASAYIEKEIASSGIDRSSVTVSVVNDLPSHAILDAAPDAGVVILGSHGANASHMFMAGSVAHQLANHCPVPLIVHR